MGKRAQKILAEVRNVRCTLRRLTTCCRNPSSTTRPTHAAGLRSQNVNVAPVVLQTRSVWQRSCTVGQARSCYSDCTRSFNVWFNALSVLPTHTSFSATLSQIVCLGWRRRSWLTSWTRLASRLIRRHQRNSFRRSTRIRTGLRKYHHWYGSIPPRNLITENALDGNSSEQFPRRYQGGRRRQGPCSLRRRSIGRGGCWTAQRGAPWCEVRVSGWSLGEFYLCSCVAIDCILCRLREPEERPIDTPPSSISFGSLFFSAIFMLQKNGLPALKSSSTRRP